MAGHTANQMSHRFRSQPLTPVAAARSLAAAVIERAARDAVGDIDASEYKSKEKKLRRREDAIRFFENKGGFWMDMLNLDDRTCDEICAQVLADAEQAEKERATWPEK